MVGRGEVSIFVLVSIWLLLTSGTCGFCATYHVARWRSVELSFVSARQYANPFADVDLNVTFVGPHMKILRPAFWDGGSTWKVRFAAPETGAWSFKIGRAHV